MALAHDFDLALDEGDGGTAARVRQPQPCQKRLMTLEEIRIVLQVAGDGFFLGIRRR